MAPGGEMFRYPQHFGENVLRHGSHEWLPYSKDEAHLKYSNTNLFSLLKPIVLIGVWRTGSQRQESLRQSDKQRYRLSLRRDSGRATRGDPGAPDGWLQNVADRGRESS